MSRSIAKIAPMVVMIGAALVLTSCTGEATDYSYPAYYYDGQAPYGEFDFDYGGCCFGGRFHHDFDHRFGHDHSFGHGFDHAGHSFGHGFDHAGHSFDHGGHSGGHFGGHGGGGGGGHGGGGGGGHGGGR
jgi:hypothetical protein